MRVCALTLALTMQRPLLAGAFATTWEALCFFTPTYSYTALLMPGFPGENHRQSPSLAPRRWCITDTIPFTLIYVELKGFVFPPFVIFVFANLRGCGVAGRVLPMYCSSLPLVWKVLPRSLHPGPMYQRVQLHSRRATSWTTNLLAYQT